MKKIIIGVTVFVLIIVGAALFWGSGMSDRIFGGEEEDWVIPLDPGEEEEAETEDIGNKEINDITEQESVEEINNEESEDIVDDTSYTEEEDVDEDIEEETSDDALVTVTEEDLSGYASAAVWLVDDETLEQVEEEYGVDVEGIANGDYSSIEEYMTDGEVQVTQEQIDAAISYFFGE